MSDSVMPCYCICRQHPPVLSALKACNTYIASLQQRCKGMEPQYTATWGTEASCICWIRQSG